MELKEKYGLSIMVKIVILVLFALLVTGCGSYHWVNRNAVNSIERDKYECRRDSEQIARQAERDRVERNPTKCSAYSDGADATYVNCNKTSGYSSKGSAFLAGVSKGLDKSNNFRACMRSRGWERVRNKAQADDALDISMECQTSVDCEQDKSCRSRKGGGTECRLREENISENQDSL